MFVEFRVSGVRTHAASKGGYQNKDAIVEFVPIEEQDVGDLKVGGSDGVSRSADTSALCHDDGMP